MIHLGGDEVFTSCYNENPKILDYMKQNNISDYQELVSFHIARVRDMLKKTNSTKTAVYWTNHDTFYQKYSETDILVYWGASINTDEIQNMKKTYPNNKVVFAPEDRYYMDCSFGNKYGGNMWCDPFKTFWFIYQFEPSDYINDGTVLGGELPVWSELVTDENIHVKTWIRALSMPDKLWAQKSDLNLLALMQRMNAFADKLEQLGIPTSPITSKWCVVNSHCWDRVKSELGVY